MVPTEQSNLYKRLEINPNASQEEIRKSYLQMAKKWHPDSSLSENSHNQFLAVSEAFEVLSDSTRRKEYDRSIKISGETSGTCGFDFRDYVKKNPNLNRNFRRERRKRSSSNKTFEKILRENFYCYP